MVSEHKESGASSRGPAIVFRICSAIFWRKIDCSGFMLTIIQPNTVDSGVDERTSERQYSKCGTRKVGLRRR